MKICVIGAGYVGLVTGTCLSDLGNDVICVDNNHDKIQMLKNGEVPIYEPGLKDLIDRNVREKRLSFTTNIEEGVDVSDIIFIAVNTPPKENGEADMCYVEAVAQVVAQNMKSYKIIVEKSTVPVQTGDWIKRTVKLNNKLNINFDVVSNPEFLREGSAVNDFLHPDRVVIGVDSQKAEQVMTELYKPLNAPIIVTDTKSSEIIKHASNSFLALKISYINAIAVICEKSGADVIKVAEGMGLDKRIGRSFLDAGIGYGGSCFPKDLDAFIRISEQVGYDFKLLKAVEEINRKQRELFVKKITEVLWNLKGKTIGVLGLAFKPNTDDMRNAPAIDIIRMLQKEGVSVKAFDPAAMKKASEVLDDVQYCTSVYEVAEGSDALILLTEWNEFKEMDLDKIKKLLKNPVLIDGRNIYDPQKMKELGFTYKCIGREDV